MVEAGWLQRALAALVEAGWLQHESERGGGGGGCERRGREQKEGNSW